MVYRILVDENVDPQTADLLRERGHDAVHVETALGKGTDDPAVAAYAREHGFVVLTNDTDSLRPERQQELTVLYCPDSAMRANEIASYGRAELFFPRLDPGLRDTLSLAVIHCARPYHSSIRWRR